MILLFLFRNLVALTLPGSDFLNEDIQVDDWNDYRLPRNLIPKSYEIELKPYLDPENQVNNILHTVPLYTV